MLFTDTAPKYLAVMFAIFSDIKSLPLATILRPGIGVLDVALTLLPGARQYPTTGGEWLVRAKVHGVRRQERAEAGLHATSRSEPGTDAASAAPFHPSAFDSVETQNA